MHSIAHRRLYRLPHALLMIAVVLAAALPVPRAAGADAVLQWNEIAQRTVATANPLVAFITSRRDTPFFLLLTLSVLHR